MVDIRARDHQKAKDGSVRITYYTDPLCCWSWALEPQWKRLRYEYEGQISWSYCMVGLVPEWNSYTDLFNSISRPLHMGPMWMQAEQISGMPTQSEIWVDNPPTSSYPACLAMKTVEKQSVEAAEAYLRLLREAVMLSGRNISDTGELFALARELASEMPLRFDLTTFERDWAAQNGVEALKADIARVKYYGLQKFPSLVFEGNGKDMIIVSGYQPYDSLVRALKKTAHGIMPSRDVRDEGAYRKHWARIIPRELEEVIG